MTTPELDVAACEAKLVLLSELVEDLDRHLDVDGGVLRTDRDRRHVVERVLTQLVDVAAGLNATLLRGTGRRAPTGYRDGFESLAPAGILSDELTQRLLPSVGMRNLLTHEYGRIDLDRVAETVPVARRDYADYVGAVREHLRGLQART